MTCHTLSVENSGSHIRMLSPSKDGCSFEPFPTLPFTGEWDMAHAREGLIGTTT